MYFMNDDSGLVWYISRNFRRKDCSYFVTYQLLRQTFIVCGRSLMPSLFHLISSLNVRLHHMQPVVAHSTHDRLLRRNSRALQSTNTPDRSRRIDCLLHIYRILPLAARLSCYTAFTIRYDKVSVDQNCP